MDRTVLQGAGSYPGLPGAGPAMGEGAAPSPLPGGPGAGLPPPGGPEGGPEGPPDASQIGGILLDFLYSEVARTQEAGNAQASGLYQQAARLFAQAQQAEAGAGADDMMQPKPMGEVGIGGATGVSPSPMGSIGKVPMGTMGGRPMGPMGARPMGGI